jgi:hypothetical protein
MPSARTKAVLVELEEWFLGFVKEQDMPSSTCRYDPTISSASGDLFVLVFHRQKNRHSIEQESRTQVWSCCNVTKPTSFVSLVFDKEKRENRRLKLTCIAPSGISIVREREGQLVTRRYMIL